MGHQQRPSHRRFSVRNPKLPRMRPFARKMGSLRDGGTASGNQRAGRRSKFIIFFN